MSSKLQQVLLFLAWVITIATMCFQIYHRPRRTKSSFAKFLYVSYYPIWACGISWIIFSCHTLKSGAFIRSFLSQKFWQPLSKLCLSIYMLNFVFITSSRNKFHFYDLPSLFHCCSGDISITLLLSLIFYIGIEAPFANLMSIVWTKKSIPRKLTI